MREILIENNLNFSQVKVIETYHTYLAPNKRPNRYWKTWFAIENFKDIYWKGKTKYLSSSTISEHLI